MTIPIVGRPTVAVIDAAALRENIMRVRAALAPEVALLAVVKADGYGHGAQLVAPIFDAAGADWFGVATVEEGIELRELGIRKPILVLTGATGADVEALREHQLSVAVLHREMARDLATAWLAARAESRRLSVHIKIDTGMGRIGVLPGELPALLGDIQRCGCFEVAGVFSHFANADRVDHEYSDYQLKIFSQALNTVEQTGERPRWVHLANSAATLTRPDTHFSLVRPGIALYGVSPGQLPGLPALCPAMRLVTKIIQLKDVPSEFPVSYGQTFVTRRPSRLAIVPIGYADGYSRALSNRAAVLVHGQRAPVVGAVCMDLTIVDVTDIGGVQLGDEVVLWGSQGNATITVTEVAEWHGSVTQGSAPHGSVAHGFATQGSVTYEVLTRLGKRVRRVLQS
jgi:alanine racemase